MEEHKSQGRQLKTRPVRRITFMIALNLRSKNIEDDKVDRGFDDIKAGCDEDDEIERNIEAVDKERQDDAASAKA